MSNETIEAGFAKKREERGLVIAALCKLDCENGAWAVPSQSAPKKRYTVDPFKQTCTCPDHEDHGHKCKHIYAVEFTIKREFAKDGTMTETRTITVTKKPTYKQDWPAYNKAQINEKRLFQILLKELVAGIPEPPHTTRGRFPIPITDQLFSSCFKVYTTFSSRRFGTDLLEAYDKGCMTRPIHPNKVNCFLENPSLTAPLMALIAESSRPLSALEDTIAADSSGFSVCRFVQWHNEKYGTRSGRDWVKVHLASGTRTNVVTAAVIYNRDTNDSPILPELIRMTKKNFDFKDLCADKAYLSVDNINEAFAAGAMPYIPFKSNSTGAVGGLYEKMFHYYSLHEEAFLKHYHQRSKVETTFSMIKRKFGDSVRNRLDTAMKNEVYAKIICHNLCCLIQSHYELGIQAEFWPNEEVEPAPEPAPSFMAEHEPLQPVAPLMELVPARRDAEPEFAFDEMFCWV